MSTHRTIRRYAVTALATASLAAPAALVGSTSGSASSAAAPRSAAAPSAPGTSAYLPNPRENAQNAALQKALDEALRRQAADRKAGKPLARAAAATVYYDDSRAPRYNSLIDRGAEIWNSRVTNVKLVQGSPGNASLRYVEGNSQMGSYYQGQGRGDGLIFIDYRQAQQYAPQRIVTHETGHALGLPDRYYQPCSKLMSGGGAGPSCTNPYPDSVEASEVDSMWRYRYAAQSLPKAG